MTRFTKANRESASTAHELLAALCGLSIVLMIITGLSTEFGLEFYAPYFVLIGVLGGIHFLVSKGLSKGSVWAVPLSLGLSIIMLFSPPIGTIAGIYLLYCLFKKSGAK